MACELVLQIFSLPSSASNFAVSGHGKILSTVGVKGGIGKSLLHLINIIDIKVIVDTSINDGPRLF